MKKSSAIIWLIALIALLAGGIYACVFGFDAVGTGSAKTIKQGLDLAGGVSITYQVVGDETPSKEDMADTVYKLQKRVEGYSTESQVYSEGSDRINIEIPGVSDANAILEELGKPGSLYFIKEKNDAGEQNYGYIMGEDGNFAMVPAKDINTMLAEGSVVLAGTDVADAQAGMTKDNMQNQQYVVSLTFTPEGTQKFADATTYAFNNGETIGIYYDGEIISAPSVNEPILGGQGQISGNFTYEEADHLASTIRIGGLKLELEELRSNVVGAQLGQEAISTSIKAALIGFAIVAVFMVIVYLVPGIASVLALGLYTVITVLLLGGFDITLTLPGIAGIILSIGMAVDADVIIFARIREEIASGKTVASSIDIGFKKALSAILDGNITTLIAAFVLGIMGTGPVKGFAQTLGLGIVVSMFTALVITKVILKALYTVGLKNEKFYGKAKDRKIVRFLPLKNIFFIASAVIIVAGFVFMGVNKAQGNDSLNYSLEFKGGTSTSVTFNEDLSLERIDNEVKPIIAGITGDNQVQCQKVQGTNEVVIKTRTLDVAQREAVNEALASNFGVDVEKITAETISSTISSEMRTDAIVAVLVATICMLIYIWLRFKDIRFAASSVLALCHDVLVVLAFYAAARVTVGNTFIACMLTIVGYSINATIVIFDRIRENLPGLGKGALDELVDKSINQTLSRSIFTSATTFIMVACLYVLGVTSIREFALPLMVGIVCGTYSSVCLTGAMWYVFRTKIVKNKK
ncbi:MAG: protein translocase subunit SecD [Lachnospiraceae bacterium]|nr:protein translocase subunit SecD [Candidatus Colinaster scatohippi]